MGAEPIFIINREEKFPHLPAAPIVEAVIHWRSPAEKPLNDAAIPKKLQERFPEYQFQEQQEIEAAVQTQPGNVELRQQTHWNGYRLTNPKDRYIAQLTPHGLVFSRLAKYDCWTTFEAEAFRFWDAYVEVAEPPVIERLGARFINQIQLEPSETPATYLHNAPGPPPGLALSSDLFFHQDTFAVAGQPYLVNSVRTLQVMSDQRRVLIVDTDVAIELKSLLDSAALHDHLHDMRYIKNRIFFALVTDAALARFGKANDV